jgi:hypothetical protein
MNDFSRSHLRNLIFRQIALFASVQVLDEELDSLLRALGTPRGALFRSSDDLKACLIRLGSAEFEQQVASTRIRCRPPQRIGEFLDKAPSEL